MLCQYSREEAKSYISGNSEQEAIQEQWPEAYRRRYNVITYYIVVNHAGCVYNQKSDKIRGELACYIAAYYKSYYISEAGFEKISEPTAFCKYRKSYKPENCVKPHAYRAHSSA